MKTTVEYLGFTCPLCEIDEILHIDRFNFNQSRLTFEAKKSIKCISCDIEFIPTIHLNEFKQAGEEAT